MVRKWSENGPKMVRKWSENGPNSERLLLVFSKVESVELLCCSDVEVLVCKAVKKNVQVLEAEKKSAWTDLDQVNFEKKNPQRVNVQIEKRRGLV